MRQLKKEKESISYSRNKNILYLKVKKEKSSKPIPNMWGKQKNRHAAKGRVRKPSASPEAVIQAAAQGSRDGKCGCEDPTCI